jgi:hypothetical protein
MDNLPGCKLQFPEIQQERSFDWKAWHGDCFSLLPLRVSVRGAHITSNK